MQNHTLPLRRREDQRLLRGQGHYLDDLTPPGTLAVAVLRSPHAHAEIARIDLSAAREMPGVEAAVTLADLGPAGAPFPPLIPHPALAVPVGYGALAGDRVRFVGEPVAAVVATSRYIAEDALDEIQVDYSPLSAVSGLRQAVAEGGAQLYPEAPGNCIATYSEQVGDPARAFAEAPLKLEAELWISRGSGQPMETRGVLAIPREDGSLEVWDTTQAPHRVQAVLAKALNMDPAHIRVIAPPDVGGGFGVKGNLYPEELLVPILAVQLGRPVKWVEDRREHFLSATQDREQRHRIELALDRDGTLLALRDHFEHDMGAYAPYGVVVCLNTLAHLNGTYRIPHLDLGFRAIVTNAPATGPFRGAGRPQGNFIVERALDMAARKFGFDPVQLRERNLIRPDEMPYRTGLGAGPFAAVYDSGDYPAAYAMAREALGIERWRAAQAEGRQQGRYIGIAAVPYLESCGGPGFEGARLELLPDGQLHLSTGAAPQGQGMHTAYARVAAEAFGVPDAQIAVTTGDTAGIAKGVGTFASRSTITAGSASLVAAKALRERCLQAAAELLECSPSDLTLEHGRIAIRGVPDRSLSLAELRAAADAGRIAPPAAGWAVEEYFAPGLPTFANGAHACAIEILPDTAELKILDYVVVHDCGKVINPTAVDGQVMGALIHGLGSMLYERLIYNEEGQLLTASYMDYLVPTAGELPPVQLLHMESPTPLNPLGVKGAGEGGTVPVHALLAQAVEDALAPLGVQITSAPLTPEQLFTWLHRR